MFGWFGRKCNHDFKLTGITPVNDFRVSQNAHLEHWVCDCGQHQTRSGFYDEYGNPEERIPPFKGECELSNR